MPEFVGLKPHANPKGNDKDSGKSNDKAKQGKSRGNGSFSC
jgi:hypothetical protein